MYASAGIVSHRSKGGLAPDSRIFSAYQAQKALTFSSWLTGCRAWRNFERDEQGSGPGGRRGGPADTVTV